jgi:type VI secretion system protein ImpG
VEIELTVDEQAFVGIGLSLFVAVLDRFFALYFHDNSFTQLVVVSAKSSEILKKCPPRSGDIALV